MVRAGFYLSVLRAYRNDESEPWVLPVVRKVELQMASDRSCNKEYLPIIGKRDFSALALHLLLGKNHPLITSKQADGVQTPGGTGAVYLGFRFLKKIMGFNTIYMSQPTWVNHPDIAKDVEMESIRFYDYWDPARLTVNFDSMMGTLRQAPAGSVVVLHGCAHNPTGMDPSHAQWEQILDIVEERRLFPFFDIAYQGFASGDLDADAWSVRLCAERGLEFFAAQSFSKNFGLYNERVGHLCVATRDPEATERVMSQLHILVRVSHASPPNHGAAIVARVLADPRLAAEWRENLRKMTDRTRSMRERLHRTLLELNTPGSWDHIVDQVGMFSYSGLSASRAEYLRKKYHIYMMPDGRMVMCSLTSDNVEYVARAMHDAVTNVS